MTAAMDYTPYGTPRVWRGDTPSKTVSRYAIGMAYLATRRTRGASAGHHHDAETGMYFAPYRDYMPNAGRWLTRDPLGMVDGPNVYAYVMGSPVRFSDAMGLACGSGWTDWIVPDEPGGYDFTDACKAHDECYADCEGPSRETCDLLFLTAMHRICDQRYNGSTTCYDLAYDYYEAVRDWGQDAFSDARECCE